MAMQLMGSANFWELVMGAVNCWVSVVLYKVKGGVAHGSSEYQGPILKYPLMVGSKMICLGCG